MSRGRLACVLAVVFCAGLMAVQRSASAGISIVSQGVSVDRADQTVTFNLDLSATPNFANVDSLGRPRDAFQYEIVPNTRSNIESFDFSAIRAVIRGTEIGAGKLIPIRDGFEHGSDADPASGGWGKVLGSVPFKLNGSDLTFTTPFSLLGTTGGAFAYRVFTTEFGATVSQSDGVSIPLPSAFFAGVGMLAVIGLFSTLVRRSAR